MESIRHNNFDIDLDFGQGFENKVRELLENDGSIEVKTERGIWKDSGNICVEVRYRGKPSGISTTNAKWWIHILSDGNKIETAFLFPVKKLRQKIKGWIRRGVAKIVMGGDDNESQVVLIPIRELAQ